MVVMGYLQTEDGEKTLETAIRKCESQGSRSASRSRASSVAGGNCNGGVLGECRGKGDEGDEGNNISVAPHVVAEALNESTEQVDGDLQHPSSVPGCSMPMMRVSPVIPQLDLPGASGKKQQPQQQQQQQLHTTYGCQQEISSEDDAKREAAIEEHMYRFRATQLCEENEDLKTRMEHLELL